MSDRRFGERIGVTDVDGLIDPDTGNIDTSIMPVLSGSNYVSTNQTNRLAGVHVSGTVVGGFVVGDLVYQVDTGAYWVVTSLPSSVQANWNPWSIFASTTDTGGGAGNNGKVFVADVNGKLDGRDVGADGSKLDGIEAGADVTDATNVNAAGAVMESDYTAASVVLVGAGAGSTAGVTLTASTILGQKASGGVVALTGAEVLTIAGAASSGHVHASTAVTYTPTTGSDWTDPDPTTVGGALDTAAARVKALEAGTGNAISFNARTGAVLPADGDYSQSLVTGLKTSDSPSFVRMTSTQATGTAPFTVASTTVVTNLNADKLEGADASATPTASTIPIADSGGKLAAGWGGSASTLATLDSSSLVVQNPANATTTAATAKIPIALTGGQLAGEWAGTGTPTTASLLIGGGAGVAPAWSTIPAKTEATTGASSDRVLIDQGGVIKSLQLGNIAGLAGSGATVTGTGALAYTVATADVAMTATTGAALDCTSNALVTTLPASPTASMIAGVMRYAGTAKNRSYVRPSSTGKLITSQQLISLANQGELEGFQWVDSTIGWAMSRVGAIELTCPIPSGTQFLMLPNATWTSTSAKDHSGNGYNATEATNPPTYSATGVNSGPAWDFDGTNDILTASASICATLGAFWVAGTFITDNNSSERTIVCKDNRTTGLEKRLFQIQVNAAGNFIAYVWDSSAGATLGKRSAGAISTATKYTYVFLYDGAGGVTLYLNNVEQTTASTFGVFVATDSTDAVWSIGHMIGTGATPDRYWDGMQNWLIAGTGTPTAAQISAFYTFGNSL